MSKCAGTAKSGDKKSSAKKGGRKKVGGSTAKKKSASSSGKTKSSSASREHPSEEKSSGDAGAKSDGDASSASKKTDETGGGEVSDGVTEPSSDQGDGSGGSDAGGSESGSAATKKTGDEDGGNSETVDDAGKNDGDEGSVDQNAEDVAASPADTDDVASVGEIENLGTKIGDVAPATSEAVDGVKHGDGDMAKKGLMKRGGTSSKKKKKSASASGKKHASVISEEGIQRVNCTFSGWSKSVLAYGLETCSEYRKLGVTANAGVSTKVVLDFMRFLFSRLDERNWEKLQEELRGEEVLEEGSFKAMLKRERQLKGIDVGGEETERLATMKERKDLSLDNSMLLMRRFVASSVEGDGSAGRGKSDGGARKDSSGSGVVAGGGAEAVGGSGGEKASEATPGDAEEANLEQDAEVADDRYGVDEEFDDEDPVGEDAADAMIE